MPTSFLFISLAYSRIIFYFLIPERGMAISLEASRLRFLSCFLSFVVFITSMLSFAVSLEPTFLSNCSKISEKSNYLSLGLIVVLSLPSFFFVFLTLGAKLISASDLFFRKASLSSPDLSMMLFALLFLTFYSFVWVVDLPKNFCLKRSRVTGSHFAGSIPI